MREVRTRFAPSPTGFLHVGSAYSVLLDYAFAEKHEGKLIIRIEDTDVKRYVKEGEKAIYEALDWLGIKPDESPEVGGPYKPYRQSERLEIYQKYAHQLVKQGNAYFCFCSPARLEKVREEKTKRGLPPMYDRKCRDIPKDEAVKIAKEEKFVIRMKIPENKTIVVDEPLRGKVEFDSGVIDDQVLLKSDGYPTYHLAVVVDDHLMEITHAVRGEEWLPSAPKHVLLYQYFGWKPPLYFHTPTLRNPDRSKLSKRKGHTSLAWYREQGYLPEALINFLCLLGWSHPEEKEIFGLKEFIKYFDLKDLSPVGPIFNIEKLDWMNGVYIRKKPDKNLLQLIKVFLKEHDPRHAELAVPRAPRHSGHPRRHSELVSESTISQTIPLIKTRITKLSDYWPLCKFFFEEPKLEEKMFQPKDKVFLQNSLNSLKTLKSWKKGEIEKALQGLIAKKGWKTGDFFMAFRIALAGSKITPPITDSAAILGRKTTCSRLQTASKMIK